MDNLDWLSIVFRWVHIYSAIGIVGGSFFLSQVLLPAAETLPDKEHKDLRETVRQRWGKWVHAFVALLFLSGVFNLGLVMMNFKVPVYYHILITVKLLLAIAILTIASLLVGRTGMAMKMRNNLGYWLKINLALAAVLIAISGILRMAPHDPKTPTNTPTTTVPTNPS